MRSPDAPPVDRAFIEEVAQDLVGQRDARRGPGGQVHA